MQFKIDRSILIKSLSHIQGVVERRNTIPILSNVKMTAGNNTVELTATDMDLALTENIAAEVSKKGSITVPAHTFHDIIKKLPESSNISIVYDDSTDKQLQIIAENCDFSLPVIPADDFPVIESGDVTHSFKINRDDLLKLFDKAKFAISTEETRYYLNGIYLHDFDNGKDHTLRAVATDGHRLARIDVPLPEGAKGMPAIIVPRKTILEVKKVLEESDDDTVLVSISNTKIKIETNNSTLLSKLIDGNFPDYERVIPSGNTLVLRTMVKPFTDAIDRVSTISLDKGRAVKLALGDNKLLLSANSTESGHAQEEITVNYDHSKIETGFNSRYIMELTSVLEGDTMELFFSDSSSPTLVQDVNDSASLFVIMPIRI